MLDRTTQIITGSDREFGTEARILHGIFFITGIAGTLAALVSIWPFASGSDMVYICQGGGLIGLLCWYLARWRQLLNLAFVLLVLMQVSALSAVFMLNNGITGPAALFFVTWIPIYIFILDGRRAAFATFLFFLVYSTLYFLEVEQVITPVNYRAENTHVYDLYGSFIFHLLLSATMAVLAKRAYLKAQLKMQASSSAKSQFLANISHEIRTPMNAILGLNELSLERSTDPQQKMWLKSSQDAAEHLLNLIEAMLDISSIDEGKLSITPRLFSPRELIVDVTNIMRQFADQKNLSIQLNMASDLPPLVKADSVRLRQVLVNLVNNAIKFTHAGTIEISARLERVHDGHGELLFMVRDTGIGIAPYEQEKIFEIFTRGENLDHFRYKGFGLGLSISRQLVEKMGGKIWLESRPAFGSSFYFTLPVELIRRQPAYHKPLLMTHDGTLNSYRILLAEDNEINAEVIKQLLLKSGFTIDRVANGEEAINQLASLRYTVILMDLEMPGMDGFQATQALRNGGAGKLNQHTPIIAVTAHALKEYEVRCREAGMQGFIAKPFNSDSLLREISRFIPDPVQDFQI